MLSTIPDNAIAYSLSIEERYKRRLEIVRALDTPKKQFIVLEHCRHNIIDWLNNFIFTYDPRVKPSFIPFDLFPRQAEYLLWRQGIRERKVNGLCEKSRDTGVTFLNAAHQLHCFLFEEGFAGGFGSRKLELVDRIGDPKTIFEKLRSMLRSLPKWMLPEGFDFKRHDNFCKLINPANGSTITGEGGFNCGRGGRTSFYDLDEAAFCERPEAIDAALSNNTEIIYYTSSANGTNHYYSKRMSYPAEWVFRFHWTDDPRKSQAWYDLMCQKFDPVTVASEVDIDYTASVSGIFIEAKWVQAAINLELPAQAWQQFDRIGGLDVGGSGKAESVLMIRQGAKVPGFEAWREPNTTLTAYKARDYGLEWNISHLNYDSDGIGTGVESTYSLSVEGMPFTHSPVHGASKPSDRIWVGESRSSADKFHNKRAELWGLMRERFRKTYNYVNGIMFYPVDELISIPNDPVLITQLSSPLGLKTATGKTLLESKEDMADRGLPSPDRADALALTEELPAINPLLYT